MARTNIDIDEEACAMVMRQHGFSTKREAVNFALRRAAVHPMTIDEALAMQGTGWDGPADLLHPNDVVEHL